MFSLSGVFRDADGDALTVTAASSDDAIATVSVASNGSKLTLAGVSEGTTTITVTSEDSDGNRVSDAFEVEVVRRFASLIPQMYEWRNDPKSVDNKEHTDRWDRALLTFGETVADTSLTPMTAAEAQDYADKGWSRWVEVAKALRDLEAGAQQQQAQPNDAATDNDGAAPASSSSRDRAALVALYNATDGPNWRNNTNWLSDKPVSEWYGVYAYRGPVSYLSLTDNQLKGSIPSELGNLSNLQTLDLDDNNLSGPIPPELGNLSNLRWLTLRDNQLSGSIPSELGNLSNLRSLVLDGNELSGSIPPELGDLSPLLSLYLNDNKLNGSIPTELGNLSQLRQLYLFSNQLEGSIPSELGNLSKVVSLSVADNQLSGSIPPELGNLSELRGLYFRDNELSSLIPSALGNLSELTHLYLNDNQLHGSIPPELGKLSNLKWFFIGGNQLSGCVPVGIDPEKLYGTDRPPPLPWCVEAQRWYLDREAALVPEGVAAVLTITLNQDTLAEGLEFTVTAEYGANATVDDVGSITSPVTMAGRTRLISIPATDDAVDEDDETFTVTIGTTTSEWHYGNEELDSARVTVTIIDDDTAGVTVNAANPFSVAEGGNNTYTVALDSQPTADVTVTPSSADLAKAAIAPPSRTFTPDDWNRPRSFSVSGEAVGTVAISHASASDDAKYNSSAAAIPSVEVTVTEPSNQAPTVSSAIEDVTIVSESGMQQVSLRGVFSDADNDALTVTARSSDEAVAMVSVATGGFTLMVSAQARGTATITVTADDGNGGTVSESFTVRVKAAPVVASALADLSGLEAESTREVALSGVFSDADGDALTVTAGSSDETKATVAVAADYSKLTVTGVAEGTATIAVTAEDADGNRVSDAFDVAVVLAPEPEPEPVEAPGPVLKPGVVG